MQSANSELIRRTKGIVGTRGLNAALQPLMMMMIVIIIIIIIVIIIIIIISALQPLVIIIRIIQRLS